MINQNVWQRKRTNKVRDNLNSEEKNKSSKKVRDDLVIGYYDYNHGKISKDFPKSNDNSYQKSKNKYKATIILTDSI